jgi:hypothetical protein
LGKCHFLSYVLQLGLITIIKKNIVLVGL